MMPGEPTVKPIPIHNRRYDTEAFYLDDQTMLVTGTLTDTKPQGLGLADGEPLVIHEMTVEMTISVPSFEILSVETTMEVNPYDLCTEILPSYQSLVGLSITRGYTRQVRELFGGPDGCSHIGALLTALGPVAVQASWSFVNMHEPLEARVDTAGDPEEKSRRLKMNTNTCHVWAAGGDQITAVELGVAPLRPEWEKERLQKNGVKI